MQVNMGSPTQVTVSLSILLAALVFPSCSVTVSSAAVISSANAKTIAPVSEIPSHKERVDISYDKNSLEEIEHDTLLVTGHLDHISLECHSTRNASLYVDWKYHGLGLAQDVNLEIGRNKMFIDLTSGPPVVRMECSLHSNQSISNSTLIYTGDGKPPYLYKHEKSVEIKVYNETTVGLPCVLNYPIETKNLKLQLFKDGKEVPNDCLSYGHELGYFLNLTKLDSFLNLTKLEERYGEYECRVADSTKDDFVSMVLHSDDFVRADVKVVHKGFKDIFWAGAPKESGLFQCIVPISKFQNKFEWYYRFKNGTYGPIKTENPTRNYTAEPQYLMDSVKINFPISDITHVACAGYLINGTVSYNNTYAVKVKDGVLPQIVNNPSKEILKYGEKTKNLTCASLGDPIFFEWLKNGNPVTNLNISTRYSSGPIQKSTLTLNPAYNEKDMNYTCIVSNYLGSDNYTFRVQLPEEKTAPSPTTKTMFMTLGIVFAAIAVILLALFSFYKVHLVRRFDDSKVRIFFQGSGKVPYGTLEEPEPIDSVAYDTSREINFNALNFVRPLQGGNFGKVEFGYYIDNSTGERTEVAIKSMKDQPKKSQDEMDIAFDNFLTEIKTMQILGTHPNVVGYLGAVTSDLSRYNAYLVVEYCRGGDVASFIKSLKKEGGSFHDDIQGKHHDLLTTSGRSDETIGSMCGTVLRTSHLMKWSEQVACGLEYIASKQLVHRDIAARNVLLACNGENCSSIDPGMLTAKISDFGLAKDLHELPKEYYQIVIYPEPQRNRPRQLPLRWISVEALKTLKFTSQSDVWAFGVLLWEMYSLGDIPYREINDEGDVRLKLISHIENGNMLPEPDYASSEMWEIMTQCWSESPHHRPTFRDIRERIRAINENRRNHEVPLLPPPGYNALHAVVNNGYSTLGDAFGPADQSESETYRSNAEQMAGCHCNQAYYPSNCDCNYNSLQYIEVETS